MTLCGLPYLLEMVVHFHSDVHALDFRGTGVGVANFSTRGGCIDKTKH